MTLEEAIEKGSIEQISSLLKEKEVQEKLAKIGNEVLCLAVLRGDLKILQLLLSINVIKDQAENNNNEALKIAVRHGQVEIMERLLKISAVSAKASNSNEVLKIAVESNQVKAVKCLLKVVAIRDIAADSNNEVLEIAKNLGQQEIITCLLEISEVRSRVRKNDRKDFKLAIQNGDLGMVDHLLGLPHIEDHVADHHNDEGLRLAIKEGHLEIVKRLLKIPEVRKAVNHGDLVGALGYNHTDVASYLLSASEIRSEIRNGIQIYKNTALNLAVERNQLSIVNQLLTIPEISENVTIGNNYTFLIAVQQGHLDIVNRLLEVPAIKSCATNDNWALTEAIWYNQVEVANRLLGFTEFRSHAADNNNEALRWAAYRDHLEIVECLLEIEEVRKRVADNDGRLTHNENRLRETPRNMEYIREVAKKQRGVLNKHFDDSTILAGCLPPIRDDLTLGGWGGKHIEEERLAASRGEALMVAAKRGYVEIVYLLAKTYQSLELGLPTGVKVKGVPLNQFIEGYEKELYAVKQVLLEELHPNLPNIIGQYALLPLHLVIGNDRGGPRASGSRFQAAPIKHSVPMRRVGDSVPSSGARAWVYKMPNGGMEAFPEEQQTLSRQQAEKAVRGQSFMPSYGSTRSTQARSNTLTMPSEPEALCKFVDITQMFCHEMSERPRHRTAVMPLETAESIKHQLMVAGVSEGSIAITPNPENRTEFWVAIETSVLEELRKASIEAMATMEPVNKKLKKS